jgi:hypothetical protein
MEENWKDIPGYDGIYSVSDLGNVKSIRTAKNRMLKQFRSKRKYYSVCLYRNSKIKRYSVHQLVAMAFLNHVPNGNRMVVDHINGKHEDNRLCNLQILSHSENLKKRNKKLLNVV